MDLIQAILMMWLAFFVVEYLNKLGHNPKKITFDRLFPIPKAIAWQSSFRWGGHIMYGLIWFLVCYFKPEILFIRAIGLVAWILFITHGILGSINFELNLPPRLRSKFIVDDIPNDLWFIFIPLSLLAICMCCWFYLDVLSTIFNLGLEVTATTPGVVSLFG